MRTNKPTEKDIIEAITRSGYLFESEISNKLIDYNFFVESNIVIKDHLTGKSREIDLSAEYFKYDESISKHRVLSKIKFIFEIKNNLYPLVLMNKLPFSPNVEPYEAIKTSIEGYRISFPDSSNHNINFYDVLFAPEQENMYTQYCSFSVKKGKEAELLASHPEALYSGFTKICHYCDESIDKRSHMVEGDFFRNILFLPVLVIKEDLYNLVLNTDKSHSLNKVEESVLYFNYHYKNEPRSSLLYVVTEKGLDSFLEKSISAQFAISDTMIEMVKEQNT